jgi:aryl-alcohol dehydrogenase (NADP+)
VPVLDQFRLGASDLEVSRFCLGTATFGGQCDEETSFRILDHAMDLGIRFIDTADKYPLGSGYEEAGVTEAIIGRWMKSRKPDVVVATKVHGATGPMPWDQGLGRRHLTEAIDASLRRLGIDAVDLYQLHRPDPQTPIEETLETLTDLVSAGKVRFTGCSNFLAYQLMRALGKSDLYKYARFVSVQPRYNLLFREHERELFPLCELEGIGVITYNLLAGGMLTGKHNVTAPPDSTSRFATTGAADLYRERYWHGRAFEAVGQLSAIAQRLGLALPVLATAWVLHQPLVGSVLLGATRPEQLDGPVSALAVQLDPSTLEEIDAVTREFRFGDAVQ